MSEQSEHSHSVTQGYSTQLRAQSSKSPPEQTSIHLDNSQSSYRLTKTLQDSELTTEGDKATENNLDRSATNDGLEDAETTVQSGRLTNPPRTSIDMPASFYNLSSTSYSPMTNFLSHQSTTTHSSVSTSKNPALTSNTASAFSDPSSRSQANAPLKHSEPPASSTTSRLYTPNPSLPSQNSEPSNVRSPRVVYLNFASTQVDASGRIIPVKRALLRNIRGFPVNINEIKTIPALNSIVLTYFADTLEYYGLSLQHLSGYAAIFYSNTAGSYSLPLGPANAHESWRRIFDYLVGRTTPQDHCVDRKCSHCQNPPFVLACFDESALSNALLSKSVNPYVDLEFLDGVTPVLGAKLDRSCDELKTAYTQLKVEAANGPLARSLAGTAASTHRYNLGPLSQYQADLFSYGQYIGRVPLPMSLVPIIPTIVSQGNNLAVAAHVLSQPGTQITSAPPLRLPGSPFTAASFKRPTDPNTDDGPATKKRRNDWGSETPPRLNSERPKDWTKATPKPTGNTKALTDSCLTCVQYGRACKGITVNDKGKCVNCQGGEKGTTKRKCYWQDKDEGILTYENARAADEKARTLPQNTRAQRALRNRSQTPSVTDQPSFTSGLIQSTMMPYPNYFPPITGQASSTASQYHTPTELANTTETPSTDTVDVDSSTYVSPMHDADDESMRYFDQVAYDHAFSSYTNNTSATNNERECNEQGSTVGTNKENSPEAQETTQKM